jgi:hypothetical protein
MVGGKMKRLALMSGLMEIHSSSATCRCAMERQTGGVVGQEQVQILSAVHSGSALAEMLAELC